MSSRAGIPPEESLQHHRDALLDQVIQKFPQREIYEMRGGYSVLKSDKAYAKFFKDVCVEQKDLLEELVQEEEGYITFKKALKESRKKYVARIDDLCFILKKRFDRHDSDSEDDYHPSEASFKI